MSMAMTLEEREAFLADLHIGVVSIEEEGRGPLLAPVWYLYEPGGDVRFVTDLDSRKGRLLERARRISFLVQTEQLPYKYVSVEGPVSIEPAETTDEVRVIAHRYLGKEGGDAYLAQTKAERETRAQIAVSMRPERWLTVDYAKRFQVPE